MAEGRQVVIKKYSNRRLYDTTHKRYVTLDEIANLIKDGNEIRVIDSQTDEDITRVILIQVVLEGEKNNEDILPASLLHMLIKYGNKMARDFFENYFLIMFQPYLSFQQNVKNNLKWWQGGNWFPPGLNPQSPFGKPGNPWEMLAKDSGEKGDERDESNEPSGMDMQILFERIKELEQEIRSIKSQKESKR